MKAINYLALVKAKLHITTDYALAKALKVSKQTAGKYSSGAVVPGPVVAFRVAEILGDQPAAVVADFEAERAERDGKGDDAEYLRRAIKRLGGTAAAWLATILVAGGLGSFPSIGKASEPVQSAAHITHRIKRRPRGWWGGELPTAAH